MSSLLGTVSPSFDEPIEMLLACHDKIRQFCDQLEALPAYVLENGIDEKLVLSIDRIIRYFDMAGPQHHLDEEEELFPILASRLLDASPKLEQLTGEHGYLHSRWNAIREDLITLRNGDVEAISETEVKDFTRLYREHAALEEEWLLPTAAKIMTQEELLMAGQNMASRRQNAS